MLIKATDVTIEIKDAPIFSVMIPIQAVESMFRFLEKEKSDKFSPICGVYLHRAEENNYQLFEIRTPNLSRKDEAKMLVHEHSILLGFQCICKLSNE